VDKDDLAVRAHNTRRSLICRRVDARVVTDSPWPSARQPHRKRQHQPGDVRRAAPSKRAAGLRSRNAIHARIL